MTPRAHSERGELLRKMAWGFEGYLCDLMETLYDETFYDGGLKPEELEYAIRQVEKILKDLRES